MPEVILHHYPQSPVSEKVRVVLGMKGLEWHSVEIPRLPPKPDLMPLTGGYRLTPVMQIGAEVFCDSLCIIRELERRFPEPTLFPGNSDGMVWGVSRWTDGPLLQAAIAVVFGAAAEALPPAFAEDRGRLYFGPDYDLKAMAAALPETLAELRAQLGWMEARLADGRDFILGARPGLPDALCYYLVWFLRGRYDRGPEFLAQFDKLVAWEARVQAIGHGRPVELSAAEALEIARRTEPATAAEGDPDDPQGLQPGEAVEVLPLGVSGHPPVAGEVLRVSAQEIVLRRADPRVGEVAVHFPRVGYRVTRA
jgi:glutathione S-transferase